METAEGDKVVGTAAGDPMGDEVPVVAAGDAVDQTVTIRMFSRTEEPPAHRVTPREMQIAGAAGKSGTTCATVHMWHRSQTRLNRDKIE